MPVLQTPVPAVIFDWGGTLTPWHTVDHVALWRDVCALHFSGEHAERNAAAIHAAERELWLAAERCGWPCDLRQWRQVVVVGPRLDHKSG